MVAWGGNDDSVCGAQCFDLRRIARDCRLRDEAIEYTCRGRVPLTPWHYPPAVARLAPRRLSDNIVLIARR